MGRCVPQTRDVCNGVAGISLGGASPTECVCVCVAIASDDLPCMCSST